MERIVSDSGPLISLSTVCLLDVFSFLKKEVVVTPSVYEEVYSYPIRKRRYMWSALRIERLNPRVDSLSASERSLSEELLHLINNIFYSHRGPLTIVQPAEVDSAVLSLRYDKLLLMDERTLRLVIEDPEQLRNRLSRKIHAWVKINRKALDEVKGIIGDLFVVRSVDIVSYAYEKGYFDAFPRKDIALKAALFALKYGGSAVGEEEIEEYVREKSRR